METINLKKINFALAVFVTASTPALSDTWQVNEHDYSRICSEDKGCAYHSRLGFEVTAKAFATMGVKVADCPTEVIKDGSGCLEVHMPGQPINRYHIPEVK